MTQQIHSRLYYNRPLSLWWPAAAVDRAVYWRLEEQVDFLALWLKIEPICVCAWLWPISNRYGYPSLLRAENYWLLLEQTC